MVPSDAKDSICWLQKSTLESKLKIFANFSETHHFRVPCCHLFTLYYKTKFRYMSVFFPPNHWSLAFCQKKLTEIPQNWSLKKSVKSKCVKLNLVAIFNECKQRTWNCMGKNLLLIQGLHFIFQFLRFFYLPLENFASHSLLCCCMLLWW